MSDRVREQGRAVVEDERGAEGEGGDHPVPHHPARRRVVEQHVGGGAVALDLQGCGHYSGNWSNMQNNQIRLKKRNFLARPSLVGFDSDCALQMPE